MSGVEGTCEAIWYASLTALTNFIFTFVGIALVERVGRRILLLWSLAGVTVCLVFMGIGFQVEAAYAPNASFPFKAVADHCAKKYSSCTSCIENMDCGFCYYKTADGSITNSSCLNSNDHFTASIHGSCSSNISQAVSAEYKWAYDYCPTQYAWMPLLGMVLYLACFSPGMGPMPWTMNSEIYPLWARGFGNSLATFVNWTANLLISMTFLSLSEGITRQGAFYLYASLSFVGFVFFFLFLPETRGRTLEEMEVVFSGTWFVRRKPTLHQS